MKIKLNKLNTLIQEAIDIATADTDTLKEFNPVGAYIINTAIGSIEGNEFVKIKAKGTDESRFISKNGLIVVSITAPRFRKSTGLGRVTKFQSKSDAVTGKNPLRSIPFDTVKELRKIVKELSSVKESIDEVHYNKNWNVTNVIKWIKDYADKNKLEFKTILKKTLPGSYGKNTTNTLFQLGPDHQVLVRYSQVAGAPRLNEVEIFLGVPGETAGNLKNVIKLDSTDGDESMIFREFDKKLKKEVKEASTTAGIPGYETPNAFGKTSSVPKGYTKSKKTNNVFKKLYEATIPADVINKVVDNEIEIATKENHPNLRNKIKALEKLRKITDKDKFLSVYMRLTGATKWDLPPELSEASKTGITTGTAEKELNTGIRNLEKTKAGHTINYGGCGAVAKLLFYGIKKTFGIEPEIVGIGRGDEVSESEINNTTKYPDFSSLPYATDGDSRLIHVMIKIGDYYIDSDGMKKGENAYKGYPYRGEWTVPLHIKTLNKWVNTQDGWNDTFSRHNIPNLAKYLDKVLEKIKPLLQKKDSTVNETININSVSSKLKTGATIISGDDKNYTIERQTGTSKAFKEYKAKDDAGKEVVIRLYTSRAPSIKIQKGYDFVDLKVKDILAPGEKSKSDWISKQYPEGPAYTGD